MYDDGEIPPVKARPVSLIGLIVLPYLLLFLIIFGLSLWLL